MPYKRFCRVCDEYFQPKGRHQKLCTGCWRLAQLNKIDKMKETHRKMRKGLLGSWRKVGSKKGVSKKDER
jgi:hypothetical protein